MRELLRVTRPAWVVAAILAFTALAVWLAPPLPPGYSGLRTAGPYAVLVTALGVAWWFNRGRSFVVLGSLLLGWAALHLLAGKAVFVAVAVLVPLNCLAAFLLAERGARYGGSLPWLALFALETALVLWLPHAPIPAAWLEHWALRSPPAPLIGRLAFGAAVAAGLWRAWPAFRPLQIGNVGALIAFFLGVEWADSPGALPGFMTAGGAILIVALLQESHRLAFRDELTGLPGRRALEERLRSLGQRYAIGMVDVDHFKQFNDTHGHDIGDQVLKLVAGRLARIEGGGIPYRYGGEEFTVLFPDTDVRRAQRRLEALRAAIEEYRMAVRGVDRPKKPGDPARLRRNKPVEKTLSVTVSIGVAGPTARHTTPAQVLKAADEALYRAKQSGRNRVSR